MRPYLLAVNQQLIACYQILRRGSIANTQGAVLVGFPTITLQKVHGIGYENENKNSLCVRNTLGLILHLLPPNIFSITENKTPSTTTSPDQPASSQKPNPRYKHTLKTFGKDESEKTYKSIFFSTEKVFVEFDFNAPDLADYEKRIRVDKAGTDLIEVKPFLFNKKVSNLGEIDIGTFEPGSYIVGGVFRRNIKSTEGLVEESFDVKRS